jgi:hypothetical protein
LVPGPVPTAQYREDVPMVSAEVFIISVENKKPENNNIEKHPSSINANLPFVIILKNDWILYLRSFSALFSDFEEIITPNRDYQASSRNRHSNLCLINRSGVVNSCKYYKVPPAICDHFNKYDS